MTWPCRPVRHAFVNVAPMSKINLQHPHTRTPDQARHAVEHIAAVLTKRFGLVCQWQGDCLAFKRAGVSGAITLTPGQVQVAAQLGFPFSLMQAQVESEIQRVLQAQF